MSQLAATRATPTVRPPASRGVARRAEILIAAEKVFLENGYGNTSMDDIAARAGASKATMYKYFGSKEALFEEIIRDIVPDIPGGLVDSLSSNQSFEDILVNWSLLLIDTVTTARSITLYRLIVAETSRCPELANIYYRKGPQASQQEVLRFLSHILADRIDKYQNLDKISRVFTSAVFGEVFERAMLGLSDDSREDTVSYVREAVAMLRDHCSILDRS